MNIQTPEPVIVDVITWMQAQARPILHGVCSETRIEAFNQMLGTMLHASLKYVLDTRGPAIFPCTRVEYYRGARGLIQGVTVQVLEACIRISGIKLPNPLPTIHLEVY
jgi:hypothetical protein